jgi:hypothetical protein
MNDSLFAALGAFIIGVAVFVTAVIGAILLDALFDKGLIVL